MKPRADRSRALPLSLLLGGAGLIATALTLAQAPAAMAQGTCTTEAEPNDTPEQGQVLKGPVCFEGTLPDGDQDIFLWDVAPTDVSQRWTFTLSGLPGTITGIKLVQVTSEPGVTPVTPGSTMLELSTSPTSSTAAVASDEFVPPGRYIVGVIRTAAVNGGTPSSLDYHLDIEKGDPLPPSGDSEPNDDQAHATRVGGEFSLSGDLKGGSDYYLWTIPDADAGHSWNLSAVGQLGQSLTFQLRTAAGRQLAYTFADPSGAVALYDLKLPAGRYVIQIDPGFEDTHPYVLTTSAVSSSAGDPEPNDDPDLAIPLDPAHPVAHGRLAHANDRDDYLLHVDDTASQTLQDIRLIWGSDLQRALCLEDTQGTDIQCRTDKGGVALTNFLLLAGDYIVSVKGDTSLADPYVLRVDPTTAPAADFETEPNDSAWLASPWDASQTMRGRATFPETDYFKVTTSGVPQLYQLDVAGAVLDRVEWVKGDSTTLASAAISDDRTSATLTDMYLLPGSHWIRVDAEDGDYTLHLAPLGPPDPNAEGEPNNDSLDAQPLGVGQTRTGRIPQQTDADVFRFSLAAAEHVAIHITPPADGSVSWVLDQGYTEIDGNRTPDTGQPITADEVLPPSDYELWLRPGLVSTGHYSVSIERLDPFPSASALAATSTLTAPTSVAAYWSAGQRLDAHLMLHSTGGVDESLSVSALMSDSTWTVDLPATPTTLVARGSADVPITIHAPSDAASGVPVRVTIRAADASGAATDAWVEISPDTDTPAVGPEQSWSVPPALLGGLDVALTGLGAKPVPVFDPAIEALLYDGVTPIGGGFATTVPSLPVTFTTDLAGDAPVPVAGIMLDPQAYDGSVPSIPRQFDLLLSPDGSTWTQVLSGELTPLPRDQAFVLPSPVMARFAQLRIDTLWGTGTFVTLGEFKVVATPGTSVTAGGLDIADPALGGHIVWMDPQSEDIGLPDRVLDEDPLASSVTVPAGDREQLVLGFLDDRAAQFSRLEWVDPSPSDPTRRFTSVDLALSLDSPLGPWTDAGTWKVQRAADGSVAPFTFKEPTWARYIRFTTDPSKPDYPYRELPTVLRVIESAVSSTYGSAVGEWGQASREGTYEALVPPDLSPAPAAADDNDTQGTASPLATGATARSTVHTGEDVDWYSVTLPAEQNTLTFTLAGTPFVGASATLFDTTGNQIPMTFKRGDVPDAVTYTATVTPGASYAVEVQQPPFSAVFTYDTSGSMGAYLPFVQEAMGSYASAVVPGREAVKIIPFEEKPLLDDWSDDPYSLAQAVEGTVLGGGSSSAETALIDATQALSERQGARAVLEVTDADTSSYSKSSELWKLLGTDRPLIFTVHVAGNSQPRVFRNFMEDWASSSGGFYQYVQSHAEMDRAFDRMATWLRRPAGYGLSYATTFVKPPESGKAGSLSVSSPTSGPGSTAGTASDVAIELILDTSGSMLDNLGSQRRIDAAKAVLTKLVTKKLPAGVPVAMRVFGDTPRSCDTRLAVPLGPLDPAAVAGQIKGLKVLSSVNTPIGGALKEVGSDLASVTGPRIVVLVTDGEENCGGNPQKAVQALVKSGVDVHVNIVGFALDTKALKQTLAKWAKTGHGSYYDAGSATQLDQALASAIGAPYRVYDAGGKVVAQGTVNGSPVHLKPGTYRVEVLTDPPAVFDQVVVAPGGSVDLQLSGS